MLGRSFGLDDDLPGPVGVDDLDPAGSEAACACRVPDDLTRAELERRPVDVARDEVVALWGGEGLLLLAERDGLADGRDERVEREVCTGKQMQSGTSCGRVSGGLTHRRPDSKTKRRQCCGNTEAGTRAC